MNIEHKSVEEIKDYYMKLNEELDLIIKVLKSEIHDIKPEGIQIQEVVPYNIYLQNKEAIDLKFPGGWSKNSAKKEFIMMINSLI
jgi:hypothetical protein